MYKYLHVQLHIYRDNNSLDSSNDTSIFLIQFCKSAYIYLSTYLSTYLRIYLPICLANYLCICLSTYICLSICMYTHTPKP